MLNSYDNIHQVESIKLGPICKQVRDNGEEYWHREITIGGEIGNWRNITLFADTREALMLDHEKETEAAERQSELAASEA